MPTCDDQRIAFLARGEIGTGARKAPAEGGGLGGEGTRALAAGAIVDEDIAARAQQVRANGVADALGAGGDEGALAEEFVHGRMFYKYQVASTSA
jgi:hypothetical protein